VGGIGGCANSSAWEVYDTVTNIWTSMESVLSLNMRWAGSLMGSFTFFFFFCGGVDHQRLF